MTEQDILSEASIIQDDGDPAPAFQALVTRLYQVSYYDRLEEYDPGRIWLAPIIVYHSEGALWLCLV
jgi:hypothetical protein